MIKDRLATPANLEQLRHRMIVEQLRHRGIVDEKVLAAMRTVPREAFLPDEAKGGAYEDRAHSIGHDQTISQPYIVAYMTEQLRVDSCCRVLEVGTGSGYQTAILALLCRSVFTMERIEALLDRAKKVLANLGMTNVRFALGDGTLGLADQAPFDRILITAGAPCIPTPLIEQLAEGGILIAPIGRHTDQRIVQVKKDGGQIVETALISCRFVKLIGVHAWDADQ